MPLVCRYKPQRTVPRQFSPNDVARIVCALRLQGVTREQIIGAIDQRAQRERELEESGDLDDAPCPPWSEEGEEIIAELDLLEREACEECQRQRQRQRQVAQQIYENGNQLWLVGSGALTFIGIQLLALGRLVGALPLIGPPASALVLTARNRLQNLQATFNATKAANDALFRQIANL